MYSKVRTFLDTSTLTAYMAKVLGGSLLLAAASQISIPFYPVPMTMQPSAVALLALICSPSVAAGIMATFILEVALGLPFLSGFSGGINCLTGTTAGYVFAFLPMAWTISFLTQDTPALVRKILACVAGFTILYAGGISWLSTFIGLDNALKFGLYPFLLKIPFSMALAIIVSSLIKRRAH